MQDLTETRSLKHVFTAEDHLKNCDEMARLMDAQIQMELKDDPPSAPVLEEVQPEITPGVIVDEDPFGVQESDVVEAAKIFGVKLKEKRKR